MKESKWSARLIRALSLLLLIGATLPDAHAQGTAFTYQGRLNASGIPAHGSYDLRFTVYDSAGGATIVAGPLTGSGVPVTDGLFTVTLDFGTGVFTGPARWLQIAVRTNGAITFTNLNPRQALSPSPYAIHAGTASNVVNGAVVKSLNNLRDNVTLAAGSNVTIIPAGNTLTIAVPSSGSSNWFGNGGDTYITGRNVGIGTTTPQGLLDLHTGVSDTSAFFVRGDPGSFGRGGIIHHQSSTYGWQELAQTTGSPTDGYLTFNYVDRLAPGTKIAANVLALRANGNVGIGTTTPATKFTVRDSLYGIEHTDGTVRLATYLDAYGGWLGTVSNHKLHFYINGGNPSMTVDMAQNVGIGTTTPAAKLDVNGSVLVRQDLTFDAGGSPALLTGVGATEQNRYLQLLNSAGFPSASGLMAGGILVSDWYGFANPGKSELIVRGNAAFGSADTTVARLLAVGNTGHGIYGKTYGTTATAAGIYGESGGANSWAGYFQGSLKTTGGLDANFANFGGIVIAQEVHAYEFLERSDRNTKTNFVQVDSRSILDRLLSLPIQTWNFTNQSESIRHIGPMAQDFHAAFDVGHDNKHISTIDADGVALAAIQGLNQKLEDELKRRDAENAELIKRLSALEELLKSSPKTFNGSER